MALPVHSLTVAMVGMAPANTAVGGVTRLIHSTWGRRGSVFAVNVFKLGPVQMHNIVTQ